MFSNGMSAAVGGLGDDGRDEEFIIDENNAHEAARSADWPSVEHGHPSESVNAGIAPTGEWSADRTATDQTLGSC
ncbi:hypothetical protein RI685_16345 (plasmid) [Clavibacter michiganensis]|uniref:hypothetical protein n=1 Tax=Clavibacter michiganensis TaxID=28447 RepID=UPI003DA17F67